MIKKVGIELPLRERLLDRDIQRVLVRSFNARDEKNAVVIFKIISYGWFLGDPVA